MKFLSQILFLMLIPPTAVFAADHYDGSVTTGCYKGMADINDFFNFMTPDQSKAVFILTVGESSDVPDVFPTEVVYQFRARPVKPRMANGVLKVDAGSAEQGDVIQCRFHKPQGVSKKSQSQTFTCELNCGADGAECLKAEGLLNKVDSKDSGLRVFAGAVKDPFISAPLWNRLKRPRSRALNENGHWDVWGVEGFLLKKNFTEGQKRLGLVVEVDVRHLRSASKENGNGMIGSIAETFSTKECQ